MTCSRYHPMISRFLDRELSSLEAAEIKEHLAGCEHCSALIDHWRLQGMHLRNHLRRHSLGDGFVARVLSSVPAPGSAAAAPGDGSRTRRLPRWLPVAAAILLAVVLLGRYFPRGNNLGFAKVIDPAALQVFQANSWKQATAGEVLHPGDWLRNPVTGAPEIQMANSARITLEAGTLAQIPSQPAQASDRLLLVHGAVSSEVQSAGQEFMVKTPAGTVTATSGRCSVRASDIVLPKLEISADGTEIMTGTVVSIGEVNIQGGTARIQTAETDRVLASGESAIFCELGAAALPAAGSGYQSSLHIVPGARGEGTIASTLNLWPDGLFLTIQAHNVPVKKLIESIAAAGVRGGEDRFVSGTLRLQANEDPGFVAGALGASLRLPISFRQEKIRQTIATGASNVIPGPEWNRGDFSFRKTQSGTISFDFQTVPAARAFQILRAAIDSLPEVAAEIESLPVTMHAAVLKPQEASLWIGRTLGVQLKVAEQEVGIIEVSALPSSAPGIGDSGASESRKSSDPDISEGNRSIAGADRGQGGGVRGQGPFTLSGTQDAAGSRGPNAVGRPLWSILDGTAPPAGFRAGGMVAGSDSGARGKATARKPEFLGGADLVPEPVPSTHLIWPVIGSAWVSQEEAPYLISNSWNATVRIYWNGYDENGGLVARFVTFVGASATLEVLPQEDLPVDLGPGGHWESTSDLPVLGSRAGEGLVLGMPVEPARLARGRSFPGGALHVLGARLWVVNPNEAPVTLSITVRRGNKTILDVLATLPAHGGMRWPEAPAGVSLRIPGTVVHVQSLNGPIALGIDK
jgi:anti-sigma factor RsiW